MKMHKTFYVTKSKKKKKPSQKALFLEIWEEREHSCVDCGKYLREPKAHNFDHILTKGSRVDLKYDKTNIDIVCFACHFYRTNKMIYK
jgi:hypothetical protein